MRIRNPEVDDKILFGRFERRQSFVNLHSFEGRTILKSLQGPNRQKYPKESFNPLDSHLEFLSIFLL